VLPAPFLVQLVSAQEALCAAAVATLRIQGDAVSGHPKKPLEIAEEDREKLKTM
jgi:hypothetical protein